MVDFKEKLKEIVKEKNNIVIEDFYINDYFVSKEDNPDFFLNNKVDYENKIDFLKKKYAYKNFFSLDGGSSILYFDSSKLLGLIKIVILQFNPITFKKNIFVNHFILNVVVKDKKYILTLEKFYSNSNKNVKDKNNKDENSAGFNNVFFDDKIVLETSVFENENVKKIEETIDISRSFLEKLFLKKFIENNIKNSMKNTDDFFFFYDGSLKEKYLEEKALLEEIKFLQLKNKDKFLLVGFNKTSNLISENFSPEQKLSFKFKDYNVWFYNLKKNKNNKNDTVDFDNDFFVSFVKLHNKSKFIFRIDSFVLDENIFDFLLLNSYDPAFFGYPYILILNDKFARVSNSEAQRYKILLSSYSKKNYLLKSAHQILDTLEF